MLNGSIYYVYADTAFLLGRADLLNYKKKITKSPVGKINLFYSAARLTQ